MQIKFRSSEVHVPDIPGMFTTFKARNVPLFVESGQFYSIYHYGKIMGYEKPLPEEMRCVLHIMGDSGGMLSMFIFPWFYSSLLRVNT